MAHFSDREMAEMLVIAYANNTKRTGQDGLARGNHHKAAL
jgi:hypothetical protein